MKYHFLCFLIFVKLLLPFYVDAKTSAKGFIGQLYFNQIFGLIHQHPSIYAASIKTIRCGQVLSVFEKEGGEDKSFYFVQANKSEGYVKKEFLSKNWPKCFSLEYEKFLETMNLDEAEKYYWGKLYDHFRMGKTKAP